MPHPNPTTVRATGFRGLVARCDVNPSNAGIHPLHVVAAFSKRQAAEKAQLLLEHRAEVDVQLSTAGTSIFACICHSSQIISYMCLG